MRPTVEPSGWQEISCPVCSIDWDEWDRVVREGDSIECINGCGAFLATAKTVNTHAPDGAMRPLPKREA